MAYIFDSLPCSDHSISKNRGSSHMRARLTTKSFLNSARNGIRSFIWLTFFPLSSVFCSAASTTSVLWESINESGPRRPSVRTIAWDTGPGGSSLAARDPLTAEWISLKYLGKSRVDQSAGALFFGRSSDGWRVQVTLIGKPHHAPNKFEYSLTFTKTDSERMLYGNCNDELLGCFRSK